MSEVDGEKNEITEFLNNLLAHFTKLSAVAEENIMAFRLKNSELSQRKHHCVTHLTQTLPGVQIYLQNIMEATMSWNLALTNDLKELDTQNVQCIEVMEEWRSAIKGQLEAELVKDEFTMMPYHKVESEVVKLKLETDEVLLRTAAAHQDMKARSLQLENEFKDLLFEIDSLNPYLGEVRNEKETLVHVLEEARRKEQLRVFRAGAKMKAAGDRSITSEDLH